MEFEELDIARDPQTAGLDGKWDGQLTNFAGKIFLFPHLPSKSAGVGKRQEKVCRRFVEAADLTHHPDTLNGAKSSYKPKSAAKRFETASSAGPASGPSASKTTLTPWGTHSIMMPKISRASAC